MLIPGFLSHLRLLLAREKRGKPDIEELLLTDESRYPAE